MKSLDFECSVVNYKHYNETNIIFAELLVKGSDQNIKVIISKSLFVIVENQLVTTYDLANCQTIDHIYKNQLEKCRVFDENNSSKIFSIDLLKKELNDYLDTKYDIEDDTDGAVLTYFGANILKINSKNEWEEFLQELEFHRLGDMKHWRTLGYYTFERTQIHSIILDIVINYK